MAEEAIGLVRSLDWNVEKGPLWKSQEEREKEEDKKDIFFLNGEQE